MTAVEREPSRTRTLRIGHLTTVDMSLALLLATELAVDVAEGHRVVGISSPGPYVERVEALGVTHVPIASLARTWNPSGDLKAFAELRDVLRELHLDVLHTHNPKTGVMGRLAGRLVGVPVVVNTCHGLWASPTDRLLKRAFVYGLEGLAAQFSDAELFQNGADLATLRPVLRPGRSRLVGNGTDLVRFAPDPDGRRRVRRELGIADEEILVGTVGRQVREKGLAEYAEAARRHAGRATFVWIGPEDPVDPSAHGARDDAVRYIGERSDMPAVYSALDIFVLASYREGFSRSGMEAAACGRPMILTDIRGCREIGDDGEQLLLVPPRDGEALARAVGRLLDDEHLRSRLGESAREHALAAFDQRSVARVSLETYAAVARRKNLGWALTPAPAPTARETSTPRAGSVPSVSVMHVLPQDLGRGAQVYAGRLRDALRNDPDQHHIVVSLFDSPEAALRADVRLGAKPGRLRRAGFDPHAFVRLRLLIRDHRPDVVVAHGGEPLKYVVAATTRAAIAYYRIGLSTAELSRPSRVRLYRALVRRVTRVVGVSQAVLDQTASLLHMPATKMSLIPNGRDPNVYHPPSDDERDHGRAQVLFVGQLERGKRPGLFLDVVAALRERGAVFDAALVGDGPLRASLEARASRLGIALLGVRNDVPALLRRADALVMTSETNSEGMPGVVIEAGLSALPVVSTAAAGVADVVVDGETGFLVPSDSADDLAARIDRLLSDHSLREAMGEAARHRCAERFTLEATARSWRLLVDELVRGRRVTKPASRVLTRGSG